MDGIYIVAKKAGETSFDVVRTLRRILGTKKVGHSGTLDPFAQGVLPVFVGQALKLLEYATAKRKTYRAVLRLGERTATGDTEGNVVETAPVPRLTESLVTDTLRKFLGPQTQVPPMYSALKVNGQRLYALARQGVEIERAARPIEIYRLEIESFTASEIVFTCEVSKGTYIRTLAEDIAQRLGTVGHLRALTRLAVGDYTLEQAATTEEIAQDAEKYRLPLTSCLTHFPICSVSAKQGRRIAQGVATTVSSITEGTLYALYSGELFIGMARAQEGRLRAVKILSVPEIREE